jgi:hypothetical protein
MDDLHGEALYRKGREGLRKGTKEGGLFDVKLFAILRGP